MKKVENKFLFLVWTGILLFFSCGSNAQSVEVDTFHEGLQKREVQIVDVRTPKEFKSGHIEDAILANWMNKKEFIKIVNTLDKETPVYLYCQSGNRSKGAYKYFKDAGFKEVIELDGGMNAWIKKGKEVE